MFLDYTRNPMHFHCTKPIKQVFVQHLFKFMACNVSPNLITNIRFDARYHFGFKIWEKPGNY